MEKKIRIQDDLYHYVNGQWLEKAVIPEDRSSVGGFADLDIALEKMLMQLFKDMAEGKVEIPNENFGKAIAIYKAAMNTKKRDEDGIKRCRLQGFLEHQRCLEHLWRQWCCPGS